MATNPIHHRLVLGALCVLCAALLFACDEAQDQSEQALKPPFDVEAARTRHGQPDTQDFTCKDPPAAEISLIIPGFYNKNDASASKVMPKAYAQNQALRQPIRDVENYVVYLANRYVASNPPRADIAACALKWLDDWAQKDALSGPANKTGAQIRKWTIGTLSASYLQIRDAQGLNPQAATRVEDWLARLGAQLVEEYNEHLTRSSRQNNHLYWAAWSVGLVGIVKNDRVLYDWAIEKALHGIYSIQPGGTLPLEMARGSKALRYHLFASGPLVMLAQTASVNDGSNLYQVNNHALESLIKRSLSGLKDPSFFAETSGQPQDVEGIENSSFLAWLEIYTLTHDDPQVKALLDELRPMKQTRSGGNMTLLFSR